MVWWWGPAMGAARGLVRFLCGAALGGGIPGVVFIGCSCSAQKLVTGSRYSSSCTCVCASLLWRSQPAHQLYLEQRQVILLQHQPTNHLISAMP